MMKFAVLVCLFLINITGQLFAQNPDSLRQVMSQTITSPDGHSAAIQLYKATPQYDTDPDLGLYRHILYQLIVMTPARLRSPEPVPQPSSPKHAVSATVGNGRTNNNQTGSSAKDAGSIAQNPLNRPEAIAEVKNKLNEVREIRNSNIEFFCQNYQLFVEVADAQPPLHLCLSYTKSYFDRFKHLTNKEIFQSDESLASFFSSALDFWAFISDKMNEIPKVVNALAVAELRLIEISQDTTLINNPAREAINDIRSAQNLLTQEFLKNLKLNQEKFRRINLDEYMIFVCGTIPEEARELAENSKSEIRQSYDSYVNGEITVDEMIRRFKLYAPRETPAMLKYMSMEKLEVSVASKNIRRLSNQYSCSNVADEIVKRIGDLKNEFSKRLTSLEKLPPNERAQKKKKEIPREDTDKLNAITRDKSYQTVLKQDGQNCIERHKSLLDNPRSFELDRTNPIYYDAAESAADQFLQVDLAAHTSAGAEAFNDSFAKYGTNVTSSEGAAYASKRRNEIMGNIEGKTAVSLAAFARSTDQNGAMRRYKFVCTYLVDPATLKYSLRSITGTPSQSR